MTIPKLFAGIHIKVIALVSMLCDHAAYILLPAFLRGNPNHAELWALYEPMRCIGRLAFPLFCFLLVEGFSHTRHRGKYALRLGAFALISEIPFDLAFNGCLLTVKSNNVMITLLIGFLALWAMEAAKHALTDRRELFDLMAVLVTAAAMALAALADSDYGASGVLAIVTLYLLWKKPAWAMLCGVLVLAAMNASQLQLFALPAVLVVAMYNGQKGRGMKYFFYGAYPGHLLLYTALAAWLW